MKVVILAGGLGTRLSEETVLKPKPMVEIGGKPVLWHIMKIYSAHGFNDFVICLGYKAYMIKEYFSNYTLHQSDVTIDLRTNAVEMLNNQAEPWRITLVDTGTTTMTGGRIKRIRQHVENQPFLLTYGDGVSNVNIRDLVRFHEAQKKYCTLTAVQPAGRFGALSIAEGNLVTNFMEKPKGDGSWINGGFMVCEPQIFDYIQDDSTILEREPLEKIASEGQLSAFKHDGYWKPMDTARDKAELDNAWAEGRAEWKIW
jgi:glucose-1-phosphate cytidylyltransferase